MNFKNFIIVTYERDIDGKWGIYNNYYVESDLRETIQTLCHNEDIVILNVIYY